jgi:7-cyano-7-deazaguanine synthase
MSKALVILSGGQDSTTLLYLAKQKHAEVHCITFDYGQRHAVELEAARIIAKMADVISHEVVKVGPVLRGSSPLVNHGENVETYVDASVLPDGLEKTFVPGRNALFLMLAANRAYALRTNTIYIGVCLEDETGYPDCRPDFIDKMQDAINSGFRFDDNDPFKVKIETPLMYLSKKQTVELAISLPVCTEALAYSHTCYNGETPPCGKCHACLLRERGFAEAGIVDPLMIRFT